jgi:hypothetical protein
MDNEAQPTAEPSVAALLGGIVNDAKELLVQEVALTKLKVRDELRKAKTAAPNDRVVGWPVLNVTRMDTPMPLLT